MIRLRFHGWVGSGQVVSPASRANSEGRKSMLTDARQSKLGKTALRNALAQAHSRFTSVVATTSIALDGFKNEAKKTVVALVDMERPFVTPQPSIHLVQRVYD
ncbi:hypothetical protein WN944_015370 [Citrus x changshan-huyou]|uniref:Uncharacterized protein n=1 Tax=Citrus x changshan-huyou TaxID=2935761 RepID=A0AAP0M8V1_9ROSI